MQLETNLCYNHNDAEQAIVFKTEVSQPLSTYKSPQFPL